MGLIAESSCSIFVLVIHSPPPRLPRPPSATPNSWLTHVPNGARLAVAGLVLVRQRPGTAKGVIFITLEDPVEYELPLIRQSQINVRAGLTYATGLRAILRQDPDTVLVGEMRDDETVDTAIRAALTG